MRKDTSLAEDIRSDLKAMDQEKEQLNRRIEKVQRKINRIPNLDRYMVLAAKIRAENERQERIAQLRLELRNAVSIYLHQLAISLPD